MRLQSAQQQTTAASPPRSVGTTPVRWPDAVAYREAIQNPLSALGDSALQTAEVVLDRRGLPVAYSGRFAVVFRLRTTGPRTSGATLRNGDWALRCFTQASDADERRRRYGAIAAHVAGSAAEACFVPFRYLEQGIRVGFGWFPVVAMNWAEGETLGQFVDRHHDDAAALHRLSVALADLREQLEAAHIAHGDWQHDNLLIGDGGRRVTLVDYDGVYVPALDGQVVGEQGHPNYQHPARTAGDYGPGMDRFAHLSLQTALRALCLDASLWSRFNDEESVLFKRADFAAPDRSLLFDTLRRLARRDRTLADNLAGLEAACRADRAADIMAGQGPPPAPPGARPERLPPVAPSARTPRSKWWQEEAQTAGEGAGAETSVTPGSVTLGSVAAAATASGGQYLDRLSSLEVQHSETMHFWWVRLAAILLILLVVWSISAEGLFGPWWVFANLFWIMNLWPRRRIHEELNGEIQKLESLVEERQERIAELRVLAGAAPKSAAAGFVAEKLNQMPLRAILSTPGVGLSTLHLLQSQGIDSVWDLQQRLTLHQRGGQAITHLAPNQIHALMTWCTQETLLAADAFRQQSAAQPGTTQRLLPRQAQAECARLEREVAGLEAELHTLRQERDAFPDTSGGVYLRKLFWME